MDWIEKQLAHARPPNFILHLGAGLCSELETYLLHQPRHIFLIEPNPEVLPDLRCRAAADERVSVLAVAVSSQEGRRALKLFNYPDLASLRQPTGLIELLPGLRQTGQAIIDVIAAQTLPKRLQLKGAEDNWLIIDTPGEEFAIIESLANHEQLHNFDRIILKTAAESLYEGARSAEDIAIYLQDLGYFDAGGQDNTDADWPQMHLHLNAKALECRRLKQEKIKLQAQFEETQEAMAKHRRELEAARQQLEAVKKQQQEERKELEAKVEEKKKFERIINNLKDGNDELKEKLSKERNHISELKQYAQRLKESCDTLEANNSQLKNQLSKHKEEIDIRALLKKAEGSIKREVRQSRVQTESYIAMNKYLEYGELLPSFHGWTISPDLAIELVRMLEENDYDLIVEFGSGSSTVLMAQVMQQRACQLPKLAQMINQLTSGWRVSIEHFDQKSNLKSTDALYELPRRILTFEHSRSYFQQTQGLLQKAGVEQFVNLVQTPLQVTTWHGKDYLFYDCFEELERASKLLTKERAKILVLVDGPPGSTNDHARYPALPLMMNSFAHHQLNFILDDSNRKEELEISGMWKEELDRRGIEYRCQLFDFEKGAISLMFD